MAWSGCGTDLWACLLPFHREGLRACMFGSVPAGPPGTNPSGTRAPAAIYDPKRSTRAGCVGGENRRSENWPVAAMRSAYACFLSCYLTCRSKGSPTRPFATGKLSPILAGRVGRSTYVYVLEYQNGCKMPPQSTVGPSLDGYRFTFQLPR